VSASASLPARFPAWIKAVQVGALAVAICFSVGATAPEGRLNNMSHQLMCTCGCAQLLGECDHIGCPSRDGELAMLRSNMAAGMSDQEIYTAFVAKYGATVLAAPTTHGFDLVAWIAPFAVFAVALAGTILLIRRWGGMRGGTAQAVAIDPAGLTPAERERRERIRRETDVDAGSRGGF
jgi:cytochrome c-type biogenesis protein CcmH/NrfF